MDRIVRIRYDAENGMAISDAKAEQTALAIPQITGEGKFFDIGTSNVIEAARCLLKEGKIDGLEVAFGDEVLTANKDGRFPKWPEGFCDHLENWLKRLM